MKFFVTLSFLQLPECPDCGAKMRSFITTEEGTAWICVACKSMTVIEPQIEEDDPVLDPYRDFIEEM